MIIDVLDAPCGAGKTTYMFKKMGDIASQQLKENSLSWIFVSPYLDEAGDGKVRGRVQKELGWMNFKSPTASPTKTASFLRYVNDKRNIAITHSLFSSFSIEAAEAIAQSNYHLVIDETIDLINFYEGMDKDDVRILIDNNVVLVGDKGLLEWNDEKYPNYTGRDSKIKELCDLQCLWLYGEDVMIQRIPPLALKACKSVTILTYMFEGSLMKAWLDLNGLEFRYIYPKELKPAKEIKAIVRDKLNIIKPSKVIEDLQIDDKGFQIPSVFCATWYSKAKAITLSEVKNSVENTLKKYMQNGPVFWTTFKEYKSIMVGKGYTRGKSIKATCQETGKQITIKREPFVSKNMRASNDYMDCKCCLYMVNVYPNVGLLNHINSFNIDIDEDQYALSELIQFIFRGCIRKGEEMDVLILSNRMRNLLIQWLEEDY